MQEIIHFLLTNADVLDKVKEGTASLIGVNNEELNAIFDVLFNGSVKPSAYYWM